MTQTLYLQSFLISLTLIPSGFAQSSPSLTNERDYLHQLKIAERKVLRARNQTSDQPSSYNPHLMTSAIPSLYFGRNYKVGDSWRIAAIQTESSMMRMTSDPHHLQFLKKRIGFFKYQVIDVKENIPPEFTIQVTQEKGSIDPRVDSLTLKLNDKTVQTTKEYRFRGIPQPIKVAPEALRSGITPLEMYPLDVPEVITAEKVTPRSFPTLPDELEKVRSTERLQLDLTQSSWFEQDDFFGRPVQVLWQKGDPWPAYMKTPTGIAILLSQEAS